MGILPKSTASLDFKEEPVLGLLKIISVASALNVGLPTPIPNRSVFIDLSRRSS